MLAAASLELKAEKKNAHGADQYGNTGVLSVGYSPDGAKVVSSGYDGTLKVCIVFFGILRFLLQQATVTAAGCRPAAPLKAAASLAP